MNAHHSAGMKGQLMKRVRVRGDGSTAEFHLKEFDENGPIRAEIVVASVDELRTLKKANKLLAVRMEGPPNPGRTQNQVNLVPWREIEDFDWEA
ncbi:hypothetical protein Q4494_13200 [Celeribacter halophilus]|uniref:Uncharacterized protein n=1 Tax=Celeribacter halophilus TaxID=576117 RepID=A0AAW7XZL7_9RHOB|nr:hypothetical protein [Celeribacter halophilus]MDO6458040.1 hypothetical protein [Celeribacter halophilus]